MLKEAQIGVHFSSLRAVGCAVMGAYRIISTPRPFSQLISIGPSLKNYRENRENGTEIDDPKSPFPSAGFELLDVVESSCSLWPDLQDRYWWKLTLRDGRVVEDFYWTKDEVRGYPDKNNKDRYWFIVHHKDGTKIEGFSQEPNYKVGFPDKEDNYWYTVKYVECGAIKAWMEEKDRNYLSRLKRSEETKHFYEEITPSLSIKCFPINLVKLKTIHDSGSSSNTSSCSNRYQLEDNSILQQSLKELGLRDSEECARALTVALKSRVWQEERWARQAVFNWLSEYYQRDFSILLFQGALKKEETPNINLIALLMHYTPTVICFKFPFTLASIAWIDQETDRYTLKMLIYAGLKRVAENNISNSKEMAIYKLLLEAALKKQMITKMEYHELDNIAEKVNIFADKDFLTVRRDAELLNRQAGYLYDSLVSTQKNVLSLSQSINDMKKDLLINQKQKNEKADVNQVDHIKTAMQSQTERKLLFSIARFALTFIRARALGEMAVEITDLSNLAEIGSMVLQMSVELSELYFQQSIQLIRENKPTIVSHTSQMILKQNALDPKEFICSWITASIALQPINIEQIESLILLEERLEARSSDYYNTPAFFSKVSTNYCTPRSEIPLAKKSLNQESVLYDYQSTTSDQLPVVKNERLLLIEKNPYGWWVSRRGNQEGLVPPACLEEPANHNKTNELN